MEITRHVPHPASRGNWEFDAGGLMRRRVVSINDLPIAEGQRLFHWDSTPGPDHPGLTDLGL
ncbi:DUF1348 family protein [Cribrihabitans sp. XS_ASV171]